MDLGLKGKTALVTGGSKGIGRAVARSLAAEGARVMICSRDADILKQAATDVERATGGHVETISADLSRHAEVVRVAKDAVTRLGRLDILVNNAAIRPEQPFATMTYAEWRHVLAVILDGAFLCSQACVSHLAAAGGGSIVNIGGETGHRGAAGRAHVVAAKAGLAGLTKALALDLAPQRITVNCVVPGRIDTVRAAPASPGQPVHRPAVPPIGRLGRPEEVAAMVRMLCGPDARYITGQAIHVNGGGYLP
jgi:3-oxoacyl-[acyl-carrier protein] reductase